MQAHTYYFLLGLSKFTLRIVISKMLPKKNITALFAPPGSRTAAVCPPHCGRLEHQPIPEPNAFCVGWCKCSSMPDVQTPIFQNMQCKSVCALSTTYQNLVVPNKAQREVACSGQSPALPVGKGLDVPYAFPTSLDGLWCSWFCNMDCTWLYIGICSILLPKTNAALSKPGTDGFTV